MIFQFFNLLDDLTVADNVLLPAQLAATSGRAARARRAQLLAQLGIGRYRDTYPVRLSGGARRRGGVTPPLINSPAVLLADAPTAALATPPRRAVRLLRPHLHAPPH